jgi:signal transduction histidine kinase
VLRNLISNALKFTPRGGLVTINSYFLPDHDNVIDGAVNGDGEKVRRPRNFIHTLTGWLEYLRSWFTRSSPKICVAYDQDLETASFENNNLSRRMERQTCSVETDVNDNSNSQSTHMKYGKNIKKSAHSLGTLVIVVTDSGVGMSKENQKRLFHEIVQFNPEV